MRSLNNVLPTSPIQKYLQPGYFNSETVTNYVSTYCLTRWLEPVQPTPSHIWHLTNHHRTDIYLQGDNINYQADDYVNKIDVVGDDDITMTGNHTAIGGTGDDIIKSFESRISTIDGGADHDKLSIDESYSDNVTFTSDENNLVKRFGGLVATDDLSFRIEKGSRWV